jgi:hypothetical protein
MTGTWRATLIALKYLDLNLAHRQLLPQFYLWHRKTSRQFRDTTGGVRHTGPSHKDGGTRPSIKNSLNRTLPVNDDEP